MNRFHCSKHGSYDDDSGCRDCKSEQSNQKWEAENNLKRQTNLTIDLARQSSQRAEALQKELMKAEEERWFFAQPEDVQRRWLEKKAEEETQALAQREAWAAVLENQRKTTEALKKLNSERDQLVSYKNSSDSGTFIFYFSLIGLFVGWAAWVLLTNQPKAMDILTNGLIAVPVAVIYFYLVGKIYDYNSLSAWLVFGPAIWIIWKVINWALDNKPFLLKLLGYSTVSVLIFVALGLLIYGRKISNLNSKINDMKEYTANDIDLDENGSFVVQNDLSANLKLNEPYINNTKEIGTGTGRINPATGRPWTPSELKAKYSNHNKS